MFFNNLIYDPERPLLDYKDGKLNVTGNCIPTNAYDTFLPLIEEFREYAKVHNDLVVNFKLNYMNTSSLRHWKVIINILNSMHSNGGNVEVNWYYLEIDERIEEQGEDFKTFALFKNFNLIKY